MERLNRIAHEATDSLNAVLDTPLRPEQSEQIARIIEQAVIKGLLEGQHRAVDACINASEAEQDTAHKIATAIRLSNDALIANLASLR
jgi:hypothetical protein